MKLERPLDLTWFIASSSLPQKIGFISPCLSYLKVKVNWYILCDKGRPPRYHTCLAQAAFLFSYNFQVSTSLNISPLWYSWQSKTKSLDPINIPHPRKYLWSIWLHCPPIQKRKLIAVWFGLFSWTCWMSHHQNFSSSSGSDFPSFHHSSFPSSQHYIITRPPHTNVYC